MEWLKVLALAVVQGITEFLPVSSSGHLVVGKHLLGLDSPGLRLEVVLHAGTLLAVCAYFWRRLWSLATGALKGEKESWGMIMWLAMASAPAVVAVVACKLAGFSLDALGDNPRVAAWGLLATGAVLLSLWRIGEGKNQMGKWRALWMGLGQAAAILPGLSRSGTTVAVARHLGVTRAAAGEFAMLMSIPVIAGAALTDALKKSEAESTLTLGMYAVGALVAAGVGFGAVAVFMKVLKSGWFWVFGVYCLAAGCAALVLI